MKNKLKYLNRMDEFFSPAAPPAPAKPKTDPRPKTTPGQPRPDAPKVPKPSNPPQPSIQPGPKNWESMLELCVERYNTLYKKMSKKPIFEDLSKNPGLPAFDKFKRTLPRPDLNRFGAMGAEANSLMKEIGGIEQQNFTDDELVQIAKDIVKKVIEGTAVLKKGEKFEDFNFDIKFVRTPKDLDSDIDKAPKGEEEPDDATDIKTAISKREIINALSQGFGITSQERMFDQDMDEILDKINSELITKYFGFLRNSVDSYKYMDMDMFRMLMDQMQQQIDAAEEEGNQPPSAQQMSGIVVPARMDVVQENGVWVIKVEAYCLILAVQEMVKGIFELISRHAFQEQDDETMKRVYAKTENWFNEAEGFIYGPMMVKIFKDFFRAVEDHLIEKGVITEYDDTMILNVLSCLYAQSIVPDEEFLKIFGEIFNKEVNEDMWPIERVAELYEMCLDSLGFASKTQSQSEEDYDDYEDGYSSLPDGNIGYEGEEEDEIQRIISRSASKEDVPSLDDLLDKISEFGMDSLTPQEKALLKKYSGNESFIKDFRLFSIINEMKLK